MNRWKILILFSTLLSIINSIAIGLGQNTVVLDTQSQTLLVGTPVPTVVAPTPVTEKDLYAEIRDCHPTYVVVDEFWGKRAELLEYLNSVGSTRNPESFRAYEVSSSIWFYAAQSVYLLPEGQEANTTKPSETDVWQNATLATYEIQSFSDLPKGRHVVVYNNYGMIGSGSSTYGVTRYDDILCGGEDTVTEIVWTPEKDLILRGTATVTYNVPIKDGDRFGGFTSYFYEGRKLSAEEFRHLYILGRHQDSGVSNWAEVGFIGGSSSSHGRFEVYTTTNTLANARLRWNFPVVAWGDRLTNTVTSNVSSLPKMHEIVVYTVHFDKDRKVLWTESQRFVLWQQYAGYAVRMLEITKDKPAPWDPWYPGPTH